MKTDPARWLPPLAWGRRYTGEVFASDAVASLIVTVMLIPQSLAYALLAGLPPQMGLYASILPLLAYAALGTSRTLSVGPVAGGWRLTAPAVGASAAVVLALLCGLVSLVLGLLRFGFLANFLSHPVVSGFITASGIIIALSQLRHLLGIDMGGDTLPALLTGLAAQWPETHVLTLVSGTGCLLFLFWARSGLQPLLLRTGLPESAAGVLARSAPVLAIAATVLASVWADFESRGVALVGEVPSGLPAFSSPLFDAGLWRELLPPAVLIALIGFVESVSVGKTLAAKRRQRIDANQELIALGAANIASSVSGGFPVTGGFSRSVVNFDAGARTPAASVMAAGGIALAALFFTPLLYHLPKATLAATIIVAVLALLDLQLLRQAWRYSRADFIAVALTIGATLLAGVEVGVLAGITASVALHLHKTTRPHIAIVGAVAGTEHFRNVERHNVITHDNLVSIRVDESLYFANAGYLEDFIYRLIAERPALKHVILQCTAVNDIDLSALEALEAIDHRLRELGLKLHLSEVKGPVMDALQRTDFLQHLSGRVFLSQHRAVQALKPDVPEPYII